MWTGQIILMMDGVACVASLHVMEHFSKSEPFSGNNTMNSIHRFDIKSNSAKLSEQLQENSRNISNPQSVKEGSGAEEFSESQCTGANVIAATSNTNVAAFVVEHVDRPKKSSRWEVVEDNAGNSRIDENELGVGLRLYKHGGGDDRHVSGSVQEDGLGIATLKNAAKERHVNQSDRSDAQGGSQSRRILDEVRSRSGHFESNFPIISVDRHSIHHKPSRTYYHSHGKTFELPSSRSHTRFSRRSESFDKGYPERNFHDRRSSYEERNGFRKSGGEKYHSRHTSHYSHSHEHRQFHRNVGWKENRWNSNYRQSQRGRSDHLSEDCKGRVTSHSGGHSRSSFSSTIKDSRSKDVEAQPGISPSQNLASEQSERSYEERNGFRKSGGEKYHSRHTSHYSHSHEHRQFHRNVGWRENRWNSNYRQSQRGRSDHLSEDCKGRVTSHSGVHSRSSFSSTIKDSRSKDVEAQPGISPSQTLASEQSERFPTELQKDSNNAHFSEQNALPEEICNFEEPRCRGWSYIDHLGFERGPSTLGDLKRLVEDGLLQSDNLIKREGTSEWVTVEHAASPMPFGNLSPPTSRGFLESQIREFDETSMHKPGVATNTCKNVQGMEKQDSTISVEQDDLNNDRLEDFQIEERIEKLLQGVRLIPGMENEILSGSPGLRDGYGKYCNHWRDEKLERGFIHACNVSKMETTSGTTMDKELDYVKDVSTATGTFLGNEGSSQASGRWPSKGGEVENFARTQNVVGCDRPLKEKAVLNDGVQLCDIWKSGLLDPRREAPSCSTQLRQLQLPAWAYCWKEERSDPIHRMDNSLNVHMQAGQASSATPKAHASTPKSQVSTPITQISTPRGSAVPICGCDGLKATKPNNGDLSKSIIGNKSNSQISAAAKGLRVCKAASSSQFEMKSVLKNNSAVFKEFGPSAWKLCTNSHYTRHTIVKFEQVADQPLHQHEIGNICDHRVEEINVSPSKVHKPGMPPMPEAEAAKSNQGTSGHLRTVKDLKLHMGEWYYCNGAGHEKGPLTFTELQMLVSEGILHKGSSVYRKTDNTWVPVSHDIFTTLHSKVLPVDSLFQPPGTANTVCRISEQSKFEDCSTSQADNCFHTLYPQFVAYAKGKLHEHVMKFYKSRDFSAAIGEVLETWMAPKQSKNSIDTQISSLLLAPAPSTADNAVTSNHMDKPIDLKTSEVKLGEIPSNTITGQLGISHIISRSGLSMSDSGASSSGDPNEETHCKVKSLEQINDKIYGTSKSSRTLDIHMSDDSQGRDIFMPPPHETDQGEPMDVDDFQVDSKPTASAIHQRSRYPKRIKLSSSGRSAKCNLEDGSFKGEASMKSPAGYHGGLDKSIKKHLATTLKEIMGVISVNTKNFFLREAAEIEDKIKGGSYSKDIRAGLKSFEDDIFLFCRKAFQEYKRDSPEHLAAEEIFKTAHRYISNLEKKFEKLNFVDTHHKKSSHPKEILRSGKDKSKGAFYSSSLNVKKRLTRAIRTSMKRTKRRRGMSYSDCSVSIEGDVSDCESWRISKQKKRCCLDSETETPESSGFLEEEFQEKDDNNDMENSDLDMKFVFDGEDGYSSEQKYATEGDGFHQDTHIGVREWGARMTRESLVPPVTRKYEVIEEYVAVADEDEVNRKMRVCLPKDYEKKLTAAKDRREIESAHLETLELKEYRPRKRLGDEVLEQEVYGIDPYTHNLLLDTMPKGSDFSLQEKHAIIEEVLLRVLNEKVRDFTGTENTPMEYPLQNVVERMIEDAEKAYDSRMCTFFQGLLRALQNRQPTDKYIAYRKGLGVVCNKESGFEKDDFVVDFLGEVYPAWRWFEKQDGIRSLQKNSKDPVPEFYNINLERPKGDGAGYDLVVVDAMHKANYASRICHSCRPNCEAKVTAIDGQYQIGIYTLRPIQYGEEITFDYNSLTESKEEYEVSVCLCGSHGCRGSYFNLAVAGGFQKVLKEFHGLLHRHQLLLEACMKNSVTDKDISDLRCAGLGTCLLSGLPNWAVAFSARVVRFMNFERSRLPEQILKHAIKLKKKAGVEILLEYEKRDAENQAEGVYNQRLQSLAITLDKVRYIIRKLHQDPTKAPPPLRKLKAAELVSLLWKGEQSLVEELLRCMGPYVDAERLNCLKQQIHTHDPSGSKNVAKSLRESLLWLRDELRGIPSSCRSRHDAAADLIHLYAHTKYFFTRLDYGPLESPPLYISPLDLGPKYADRLGSGFQEWKKIYSKDYALGQLMYWYVQTFPDPGYSLNKACRGCLVLPDITSCYAKTPRQQYARGYGSRQQEEIIRRMEQQPQKQWPKGEFWEFNNNRGLFGSPVFDVVMDNSPLDKELMKWLKTRPAVFDGPWDH